MADFSVDDRRGRRVNGTDTSPGMTRSGMRVFRESDQRKYSLPFGDPREEARARAQGDIHDSLRNGRPTGSRMRRTASTGVSSAGGVDVQLATGRPRDPMWYWRQNNIPYNFTDPEELSRIREFCNDPAAPVSMADGTTKPMSAVAVNDMVWGWDWIFGANGKMTRKWVPSRVLATWTRTAPVRVQATMASGKQIICTPDHQWLDPYFTMLPSTQVRGAPIDTKTMNIAYRPVDVGVELFATGTITTGIDGLGMYYSLTADATFDKCISITPLGAGTVACMQTETGNYVAWGYASKNCRLLYVTHPIVSACIDVYSKLPMQGMSFECKDPQLVDFYSDLFFDQLNYEEFLLDLGTEYWLSGESWALGGWNETLGVWEADELINPDDVEIEKSLFMAEPHYLMRLPESLRQVLTSRQPHWQYVQLIEAFPELLNYVNTDDLMPVSNVILKQMRFKADRFSNRGIPILMRGFRTLIQEEMLNSALDSIADRLYTPLILTKLGATAGDLGTNVPWIPSRDDMDEFNAALDTALAADFRALTYHWAIDMQPVFGRENVPDLSNDFDRIVERILMVFGLSQTMLTGASAGETYAADALNRDVVTQLLSHYQKMLTRFVQSRTEIVAEAQEHFDYEVRGAQRYLVTEEVYEVDEETGEERIIEQPKLLVPQLNFKTLNISDEETERQFVESLAEAGVPVPYRSRLETTGIDFDEMIEQRKAENVALAVADQETRKETFQALQRAGLPIPQDLATDFSPKAIQAGAEPALGMNAQDAVLPNMSEPPSIPALAPTDEDEQQQEDMGGDPSAPPTGGGDDEGYPPQEGDSRPEESDEEREDMPKAAALVKTAALPKLGIQQITRERYQAPDNSEEERPQNYQPSGRFGHPHHIGMRRYLDLDGVPVAREEE